MTKLVVLTGITGFIAKRIALDLLEAGYEVRGSLRKLSRADEVRDALRPRLSDAAALDRLGFVELDLGRDDGWTEAMAGADALLHTASPFPMVQPKNEDDIVRPAVDGTLRALRAAQAAGVTRVVLTSSVVAIEATDKRGAYTEQDWSDTDHPKASAYYRSKTLAERAAWDFAAAHPEMQLTTINPALVLGEPLDRHYGTSLSLIERILAAKDPMQPDIGFGVVDVADISAMHVAALERPESIGHRFIGSNGTMTMPRIAQHLAARHPDRRIATRVAPKALLRLMAPFDRSIRSALPSVGAAPQFDNARAREILGISFAAPLAAIDRAADAVIAQR
ncbi:NAD-dependent epimerase/dehydratase family protein [Roseibacterium sp. SDUM158017]|uniref:NAD-dependent epimerase/dehydratase family protein n=1 Tax=Roseicyclus salinarum TaxID=3036773 RepID=UPI002414F5BD|nr:NAD-dependent epimerase/dehydratase family protein [Roseibacterium sp. SDUM158017]MDG4649045.1 NAD-dependent epimerase/dehydratase family protein [Roseibacterium sp. SDUM158017]